MLLDGSREVLPVIVIRLGIEFVGRMMQLRLRTIFVRTERCLAIALPVATAAAATAPSSTPSVARLALARNTFRAWLRLAKSVFFGRAAIMVMRDGVFGRRVVREALCVLCVFTRFAAAATASTTAPASASARAIAFSTFAFAAFDSLFGFSREFGLFEMFVGLNRFVFDF